MSERVRILAGSVMPGGATCIFPVLRELRGREGVRVHAIAHSHAADIFRQNEIEFVDLAGDGTHAVTEAAVREIINRFEPDLILSGVFGPIEGGLDHWLISAARDLGIPSFGILDAWMNYTQRFADPETGDATTFVPDRLAVMDRHTADELAAEGIPADRIVVTGHPFVDVVRQHAQSHTDRSETRSLLGATPADRVVLFVSEPLRWGVEQGFITDVGYDEFDAFELLAEALAGSNQRGLLVVKEHPRHASLTIQTSISQTRIVRAGDQPVLDLIQAADVVVGMSSTLLVYAYLMGRKVVVVQPNVSLKDDRNVLTRRGILQNSYSMARIHSALEEHCTGESEHLEDLRREFGWYDRIAAKTADSILTMVTAEALTRP
jgi:hypothetical protein